MPHYKDGTVANIGDKVKGKPYNTDHEIIGEVVQVTPGTESCNCIVAFVEVVPPEKLPLGESGGRLTAVGGIPLQRTFVGPDGQLSGLTELVVLIPSYDYGETKAFERIA